MILVDANLLVYAHVASLAQHAAAREWLDGRLNGPTRVGLPWSSLIGFLRIVTNPRIFERPEPVKDAWGQVIAWLECPNVWVPTPAKSHPGILSKMLGAVGGGAGLIPDAHLAALALEHGLTLCSADGDFARFPELRWENPIIVRG